MLEAEFSIDSIEQNLFAIEDTRKRADQLKKLLVPKLKLLLSQACDLIGEVYGSDTLQFCRITTTPAHRPEAKNTKPFDSASAGLAIKGQHWYFQQRFECTADGLSVRLFGLRGLESNPIIQVLKKHSESVVDLLDYGGFQLYSESLELFKDADEPNFAEFIGRLQLVPERDWCQTSIEGISFTLPIEDFDAAWPVINDFIILFPIFRAAANILSGEEDHFEIYAERFWDQITGILPQGNKPASQIFPDEVDSAETFVEGSVKRVSVNAYERDHKARQKCLEHYGLDCSICGFNFGKTFGQLGEGFIHVHHLRPISEIAEEYEVDPVKDLRPVCPNCHAMIHRRSPPLSIEKIKALLKTAKN